MAIPWAGGSGNGGGRRRGGRCRCQVGTHRKTRRRGQTIVGTEEYRSRSGGWCLGGTWSYFMGMIWACILFGEWPSEMKGWLLCMWRMVCCGWEACRSPTDDLDVGERERYPRDHVLVGFTHTDQFVSSNFSSVQFSHAVMSDSLWPHELQHSRLPCPSPTPRAYSNSCPSHWWCHPTISSSVVPLSSHLQSFPASGSFQMSQFFSSGGRSVGVSASTSVLPMNISFRIDWLDLLAVQGTLQESSPIPQFKSIGSLVLNFLYSPTLHTWLLEKP